MNLEVILLNKFICIDTIPLTYKSKYMTFYARIIPLGCKYPKDVLSADYFGPNGLKIYLFSTSKIGLNVAILGRVEKRPKKDGKSTFASTFFSCLRLNKSLKVWTPYTNWQNNKHWLLYYINIIEWAFVLWNIYA